MLCLIVLLPLLILLAVIARTVGSRFKRQVPDSLCTHHAYVNILGVHDVAALPNRRDRLAWLVNTHGERCRRDGKWLTKPAARVRRDRKLHAAWDADLTSVTFRRFENQSLAKNSKSSLIHRYWPTLWQPGFCHDSLPQTTETSRKSAAKRSHSIVIRINWLLNSKNKLNCSCIGAQVSRTSCSDVTWFQKWIGITGQGEIGTFSGDTHCRWLA